MSGATDDLGNPTMPAYNPAGLVASRTDRLGRVKEYAYDADNRLTTEV